MFNFFGFIFCCLAAVLFVGFIDPPTTAKAWAAALVFAVMWQFNVHPWLKFLIPEDRHKKYRRTPTYPVHMYNSPREDIIEGEVWEDEGGAVAGVTIPERKQPPSPAPNNKKKDTKMGGAFDFHDDIPF